MSTHPLFRPTHGASRYRARQVTHRRVRVICSRCRSIKFEKKKKGTTTRIRYREFRFGKRSGVLKNTRATELRLDFREKSVCSWQLPARRLPHIRPPTCARFLKSSFRDYREHNVRNSFGRWNRTARLNVPATFAGGRKGEVHPSKRVVKSIFQLTYSPRAFRQENVVNERKKKVTGMKYPYNNVVQQIVKNKWTRLKKKSRTM